MRHLGTLRLETPRLLLRRFVEEDAEAMYFGWARDERVSRYMRWRPHAMLGETCALVRQWVREYACPTHYHWAIQLRDSRKLIGAISVVPRGENDDCFEAGYNLAFDSWGHGYAAEALEAVIRYIFERVQGNRVEAYHAVDNPASGRVMEKCGMRPEGVHRQKYRTGGGDFVDCRSLAVLRADLYPGSVL
jgi:ribosomal-protein-alanine N-acetyltransferase